jgi:hypothetical protein
MLEELLVLVRANNTRSNMTNLKSQPLYFQVVLIGSFIFIALMLFALAQSIYRDSFQVGHYIDDAQKLIETSKSQGVSQKEELAYAETPQYQEKVAKELLGLKLPGESVIILTGEEQNVDDLLPTTTDKDARERALLSNPEKWWRYLFGI